MPTESGDPARHALALEGAVDEALAELPDEDRAGTPEAVDYRWLSAGMRLGLERPKRARHLLEMIRDQEADRAARLAGEAADVSLTGVTATDGRGSPAPVPTRSSLLARAATLPWSELESMGPEVTFGWAAALSRDEILSLGRVVHDMLAAGSPPDIGRGFGLAWQAGVRLPPQELRAMFREFTELEITVSGVLAGRDLRAEGEAAPRPRGLGALFDPRVRGARPGESQAAAVLETSGEPGRRGLVSLWNAWVALRYRSIIPQPTFDLLAQPWVTVVGPLPGP